MEQKTRGSKIIDIETGQKQPKTIKDIISQSESWMQLTLFLIGVPLTIITLLVYAASLILPLFCAIPLGITIGLAFSVILLDKIGGMLK